MNGSRTLAALTGALGVALMASTADAAEHRPAEPPVSRGSTGEPTPRSEADPPAVEHGPAGRRNAIVVGTHAKIPDWSSSLTYQRAFGKRLSVGAGVEYGYQQPGYWHLQGMGESLSGQFWLGRTFHGVFVEGSLALMHQFLGRQPRLSTTALVPGLSLGFRWTHRNGLTVGASGGLRWGRTLSNSDLVCTRAKYCNSVRTGPYVRMTADIGYVF